ncbi:YibE/F family protein [Psychromicrobium xiongbiense]|uniref:YibE/F family protein n=1 Tax=Psychromicrobium xiongbiense TaxID=3051184 RepID=UPI002555F22E|nr:YibE/F family protein [Psychromicrobium sp. YIM S02556]
MGHSHLSRDDLVDLGVEPDEAERAAEQDGPEGSRRRAVSPQRAERERSARRRSSWLLSLILVPLGLVAVVFMVVLWPTGQPATTVQLNSPYAAAPGASIDTGKVQRTEQQDCPQAPSGSKGCLVALTTPDQGGAVVPVLISPEIAAQPGVHAGDSIRYVNLSRIPGAGGVAGNSTAASASYVFMDFVRGVPMLLLALVYAAVVIAVARWRGLRALVGLVVAYAVLALFVLPGLVEGKPALGLALVGSAVIMYVVLYFSHGVSARTSTALIGTLFGLAMTAGIAAWATGATHLTGTADHNAYQLQTVTPQLSISGMITCGLIIASLGVLNDVTITQASAVWELWELAPGASARKLFGSAMRIGRDHIASTVYTIAFAYAGSALPALILVSLYKLPLAESLTSAELAEEIVRTLVGSIGLVLAIPVTTAVAVLVVKASGGRAGAGRVGEGTPLMTHD